MNRSCTLIPVLVLLTGTAWVAACSDGATEPPPDPPRATTVEVTPTTAELTALEATVQLSAGVRDQNGNAIAGAAVAWSSGDASVAAVDAAGVVTAAANGTATITATAGAASGSATVTVAQQVAGIAMSPPVDTLVEADTLRLSAEATDSNGHAVEDAVFAWTSGDTLVARVDDSGLVTGVAAGDVEITATSSGVAGLAALTVEAPMPTAVEVTPDTVVLTALGQAMPLSAAVLDQIGRAMPGVSVSWSSGDTLVATVDTMGLVTAAAEGATAVVAMAGEASGEAVVRVTQAAGSVIVSPASGTVALGDTLRLEAKAFDDNGHRVAGAVIAWSSNDASVARVDASGLITGIAEGAATITATAGAARGTAEITVANPDRAALVALYEATDGPNWVNSEKWLSDAPLGEWYGVETDGTGRVVRIRISYNLLAGPIPSEVSTLTELQHLGLDNNGITGPLPAGLAKLRNLQVLDLHANSLQGPIPPELGDMSALSSLDFVGNSLTGTIPRELGKLSNLESLDLALNRLTGSIPGELGGLRNLRMLRLDRNTLSGPVPSELGNLSALTWLSLRDNLLEGALPQSLLDLESLERLTVDRNPELCTPGTSAFQTWLQGVEKDGAPFCSESDQAMLAMLYENAGGSGWTDAEGWLGGPVLADWHGVDTDSLGRVASLDLARNALGGRLPARLGELAHMTELRVEGNSNLAGRLPVTLARLTLDALHYGGTGLCVPAGAPFRSWLASIPFHEGTGAECVPLSDREILSTLYETTDGANWRNKENWLTDAPLGDWQGVEVDDEGRVVRLELPFAGLSGPIPSELGELASLRSLDLGSNGLSGSIPPELGKLARLAQLDFRFNNLSGSIPSELGGLVSLERMEVRHNHLSGSIPPELGNLSRLEVLFLENNRLTGPIPPELGDLESLRVVSLGANGLSGSIPKTLANLAELTHLILVRNRLTGRIPRELGSLPRLTELFLGENDLTGPIPPELGNLAELTGLDVRDNRLAGPIPREFGGLSRLTSLHLAYNGLTGSLPPELGNLSALASLLLGHNQLSGSVPPELGRLTSLRELSLFGNAGLSGALPADLTALGRLEALMAGGTGLCAPSDAAFTAWLEGVEQHRVARCADEPTMAYLTQAVQSRQFPVPLIAGRDALLRVFVTASNPTGAGIPPVRARFYRDGAETYEVDIPGKSTPIPAAVVEADLEASANVEIPGEVVRPGLEMVIDVDPDGTLDSSLGVTRRMPATGRIALDVRAMPTFNLTVVPLLWRESPDSAVLARTRRLKADDELFRLTRTILPVGDFEMAVHEPVVVAVNRGDAVIRQIELIWTLEGRRGHYLGVMSGDSRITGAGGTTRISALDLRSGDPSINGVTQAHEFGHNMSLMHTVRSQNSPDPSYPHAAGSIGAYGYDFRNAGSLVPPSALDVMGFANLSSWISDYHFTKALRFRLRDEAGANAKAAAVRSLISWGGTDSEGVPLLEPAFVADAPPALPSPGGGAHRITGRAADGRELFSLSFGMTEISHAGGAGYFVFALPVQLSWEGELASITLSGPAGSDVLDGNAVRPMTILRDSRTGQVRGLLREARVAISADGTVMAGAASPVGQDIEVLFSRGLPETREWRR